MAVDMVPGGRSLWSLSGHCAVTPGPCGHSPVTLPPPGGAARRAHRASHVTVAAPPRPGTAWVLPWQPERGARRHGDGAAAMLGRAAPIPPHGTSAIVLIPL